MVLGLHETITLLYFFISIILSFIVSFGIVRIFRRFFISDYVHINDNYVLFVNDNEKNVFSLILLSALYLIVDLFIENTILLHLPIILSLFYLLFNLTNNSIEYIFNKFINIDLKKDIYIGYSKIGRFMKKLSKLVMVIFYIFLSINLLNIDFQSLYSNEFLRVLFNLLFIILVDSVFVLLGFLLYNIVKKILIEYSMKTKTRLDDFIYRMLEMPLIFIFVFVGINFSVEFLDVSDKLLNSIDVISNSFITLFITILIIRIVDIVYREYVYNKSNNSDFAKQIGPLLKGIVKVIIIFIAIVIFLDYMGVNVTSLVAGLGIGGVAVALAAQDTLSNFFGSISIFSDKPFKIGDRIKTSGYDGFVEEIGIRSTRIKTLDGSLLIVPNNKLAKDIIENISLRQSIKVSIAIGLTYSASESDIKKGVNIIREILKGYEENNNLQDGSIVFFEDFAAYSLNIRVMFWILELDWTKAMYIKEEIYYEIYKKFNENNLDFAFPSQTIYLDDDNDSN